MTSAAAVRPPSDTSCKIEVEKIDQVKIGIFHKLMPGARMLTMVAAKLAEPSSEAMPLRISATISTVTPVWLASTDSG